MGDAVGPHALGELHRLLLFGELLVSAAAGSTGAAVRAGTAGAAGRGGATGGGALGRRIRATARADHANQARQRKSDHRPQFSRHVCSICLRGCVDRGTLASHCCILGFPRRDANEGGDPLTVRTLLAAASPAPTSTASTRSCRSCFTPLRGDCLD